MIDESIVAFKQGASDDWWRSLGALVTEWNRRTLWPGVVPLYLFVAYLAHSTYDSVTLAARLSFTLSFAVYLALALYSKVLAL